MRWRAGRRRPGYLLPGLDCHKNPMKIYLDVCCLNRPFDDQAQDRIHLESEAVIAILKNIESNRWMWISSTVVLFEVNRAPSLDRRRRLFKLCDQATAIIRLDDEIHAAARALTEIGFKSYDALHLACAKQAGVDVFLSTDDQLVKKATQHRAATGVTVSNPLTWLQEML